MSAERITAFLALLEQWKPSASYMGAVITFPENSKQQALELANAADEEGLDPTPLLVLSDEWTFEDIHPATVVLKHLGIRLVRRTPADNPGQHEQSKEAQQVKGRTNRGGKPSLEKKAPLTLQVYQRIQQEHRPSTQYSDAVARLKNDKQFVEQVAEAKLKLDTKLVRKALAYFDTRQKREQASNKQQTGQD